MKRINNFYKSIKFPLFTVLVTAFLSSSFVSVRAAESDSVSFFEKRVITLNYEPAKTGPYHYRKIVRPKVGIALSGGGLRGFAQIGVIDELEKAGIPVDFIAGSSMGSIVGGLYAIGYSPEELEQFALETDWSNIFSDTPERSTMFVGQKTDINRHILLVRFEGFKPYIPQAISQGQQIFSALNSLVLRASTLPVADFDDFKIPLRIVALDKYEGKQKIFRDGNLALAILGSIAAPFLFSEVKIGNHSYVDGGIINNIPTDVVRSMGSDIVVAIDCTSPLLTSEQMVFPWKQMDHYSTIMQKERNERSLQNADIAITPELGDRDSYDFGAIPEFIELGRRKTREIIPDIRGYLQKAEENDGYLPSFTAGTVEISGNSYLTNEFITRYLSAFPSGQTSDARLKEDLKALFETGYFDDVKVIVKQNGGVNDIEFRVTENPVIKTINIIGNTVFSTEDLAQFYIPGERDVFTIQNGEQFINSILKRYNQDGYSIAQVTEFRIDPDKHTLTVVIDEGRVTGIQLLGNDKTQPHVIKREMPINAGDIFDFSKVQKGINNIYGTGLFLRVYPAIIRNDDKLILQINLEEHKSEIVRIGVRYDLDQKTKGFIELSDDNFGGLGMKSQLHARYGTRDEVYRYQFRMDRIFLSYLTMNGDFHYTSKTDFLTDQSEAFSRRGEFKDTRIGGSLSLGQQLGRFGTVSARLDIDDIKIEAFPFDFLSTGVRESFIDRVNERIHLRTVTFQSIVDTRDKIPFPSQGNFHQIYYENASSLIGSEISYVKFFASLGYVYTINGRHTLESRLVTGFADDTLPYAKRFRWGGMHSFFGKRLNTLHGRMIVASNIGYRLKLPFQNMFDTYLQFRWDFATVVGKYQKVKFKDFKHAVGTIVSMNLPLGPIEFGYGKAFNDDDQVYFSLGYHF